MTNGQTAFEAHAKSLGNIDPKTSAPVPTWAQLPAKIQASWEAAASAVLAATQSPP